MILYFLKTDINQSIPLVAWNRQQESGLQTENFMMLLHKLRFHMGKFFPRIPHFWTADHMYQLIQRLGPIKQTPKMDLVALIRCSDYLEKQRVSEEPWPTTSQGSNSSWITFDEGGSSGDSLICQETSAHFAL